MTDRSKLSLLELTTAVLLVLCVALPVRGDDDEDDNHESNQALIELKDDQSIDEILADYAGQGLDLEILGSIPALKTYLLLLPEVMTEEQFETLFEQDPRIDDAELNHTTDATEGQTQSFFVMVGEPEYGTQYARERVGLDLAHDSADGAGVVVAVLDTGIDADHPALAGLIAPGGFNFVDGSVNVDDIGIEGVAGHGTYVAGIIAMVAPQVSILPLKVLDENGMGNAFQIAVAMLYAVDHGADVINLSLGSYQENSIFEDVLEYVHEEMGVLVVSAAGNNDQSDLLYPAAHSSAMGIAATDAGDLKAPFSNYGEKVSMSAPGLEVVSTVPGGDYAEWEGTSISAAFVSGAAALLRSVNPAMTPEGIERVLEATQAPLPPQEDLEGGRLDAGAAVAWARGDFTADGMVAVDDLATVILNWGECSSDGPCLGDATGDAVVDVSDLVAVITNWG